MADDKTAMLKMLDPAKRKKIIIGVLIVVVVFLIWQMSGMFSSGGGEIAPIEQPKAAMSGTPAATPSSPPPAMQPTQVARQLPMSERERELLKLQQQTQAKYVETLNELQMLRLSLEVAETNKNIMAAKLETIKNQKDIVDLLSPPKPEPVATNYGQIMAPSTSQTPSTTASNQAPPATVETAIQQVQQMPTMPTPTTEEQPQIQYTVVSVSKLQNKWSAVIGVQGALYQIQVGDIIPADGSKVKSISSSGIVLERDGKERKVSLVPII